jgi:hypothetical protein
VGWGAGCRSWSSSERSAGSIANKATPAPQRQRPVHTAGAVCDPDSAEGRYELPAVSAET